MFSGLGNMNLRLNQWFEVIWAHTLTSDLNNEGQIRGWWKKLQKIMWGVILYIFWAGKNISGVKFMIWGRLRSQTDLWPPKWRLMKKTSKNSCEVSFYTFFGLARTYLGLNLWLKVAKVTNWPLTSGWIHVRWIKVGSHHLQFWWKLVELLGCMRKHDSQNFRSLRPLGASERPWKFRPWGQNGINLPYFSRP